MDDEDIKFCSKCGVAKVLADFYRATGTRDGRRGECIECARAIRRAWYEANREASIVRATQWRVDHPERSAAYQAEYRNRPDRKRKMRDLYYRRTFGISADEVDEMIASQGAACALCAGQPERLGAWHVDHDHDTGRIRGVLCSRCNHAIGLLRDDPELLERAASYLRGG